MQPKESFVIMQTFYFESKAVRQQKMLCTCKVIVKTFKYLFMNLFFTLNNNQF